MKAKSFILSGVVVLLIGAASSCSGSNDKDKSDKDSVKTESVAAERSCELSYKIENGRVVSADGRPLVVDFYADWCPPCRQMKPVFERLADKYGGNINFVSINVDENEELAKAYGIQSIPYFLFADPEGKKLGEIVGAVPESSFVTALADYFPMQVPE